MHKYIDYIYENAEEHATDEAPHAVQIVPAAMNGSDEPENTRFVSAGDFVFSAILAFGYFDDLVSRRQGKAYAKFVMKNMPVGDVSHKDTLRALCDKYFGDHGNANTPRKLYKSNGITAEGSLKELEIQTGLPYTRVQDLTSGRRRYAQGWSASKEEALKGPLKRGPKPKSEKEDPLSIFTDDVSDL